MSCFIVKFDLFSFSGYIFCFTEFDCSISNEWTNEVKCYFLVWFEYMLYILYWHLQKKIVTRIGRRIKPKITSSALRNVLVCGGKHREQMDTEKRPNLFRLVFNQIQWKTNEIMKTKKNLSFVNNWTEKRQFILVFCCFINRIRFQQSVNDIVDMNEWKLRLHVVWEIDMCRAIVNILLSFQHRFFH